MTRLLDMASLNVCVTKIHTSAEEAVPPTTNTLNDK